MNYQNNGKKEKSSQMKTIYITLALSLALMAILIILSGSLKKESDVSSVNITTEANAGITVPDKQVMAPQTEKDTVTEEETDAIVTAELTTDTNVSTEPVTSSADHAMAEDTLPEFVSPVAGHIMKKHSGDTPVFSITMNDYRPHIGVDIYAAVGNDVFAAAEGTVKDIWEDPMSGNCISIAHSGGAVTIYRNLAPTVPDNISVGAQVSAGEVIGTVGDTSLLEIADESHLHFELMIDDINTDPAEYVSFNMTDTEYEG